MLYRNCSNKLVSCSAFFTCLILFGCGGKENFSTDVILVDQLPPVVSIKSEEIKLPIRLLKPDRIHILDSLLVVYQERKDSMFTIFRLPTGEHLVSFGSQGAGPQEFNLAFPSTFETFKTKNFDGFAMGNKMFNIQYYKISDLLQNHFTPYKINHLSPDLNGYRGMAYIGDSVIFGEPYSPEVDLFQYNSGTATLDTLRLFPTDYPLITGDPKRDIYAFTMTRKPDNSKFAIAYTNKGELEIFDVKDPKRHTTISYKNFPTLGENLQLNSSSQFSNPIDAMIFCWAISSTDRYIYAKIFNCKYKEATNSTGMNRSFIPEIHVFDWSGNLITRLKPDRYYKSFDVDKNDSYLISSETDQEGVSRYDLTGVLPQQ